MHPGCHWGGQAAFHLVPVQAGGGFVEQQDAGVGGEGASRFMERPQRYDAHGLLIPTDFVVRPAPTGPQHACLDVARRQRGTWVTQVPDMDTDCFEVPALPIRP